jgi:acyl-coenzyme A synthetase/AMP-(fatty) acid ligase
MLSGSTYDEVCNNFKWEIPDYYNIGVSEPIRGEIVKAFILPQTGVTPDKALEQSIQEHVKKRLEAHAYPREVAFVDEMPKTKTGKILRKELRRMHKAAL